MASDFYHTFFPRYSNHNSFTVVVVSYMCSHSCHGIQMQNTFFICIWTDRTVAVTTKHSLTFIRGKDGKVSDRDWPGAASEPSNLWVVGRSTFSATVAVVVVVTSPECF